MLALGLLLTGAGATVFLRTALAAGVDEQVQQLARTEVANSLLDIAVTDGVPEFSVKSDVPPTNFVLALYSPVSPGNLEISAGGGVIQPDLPATFELQRTVIDGTTPFSLENAETGAQFRASVATLEVHGVGFFTQLVALPLAPVSQTVATFLGIYTVLGIITLVAAALLTRGIVTLTFRSLGQVEATAMEIASGDFSQRMTDIVPSTEVGKLKIAINTMLGRVDASISERDATVRQMRRFIGDASHELRTPLVTVRGYAELYRMGAIRGEEDTAQAMERIEKEAIRMGLLVEDLLALARLDERRDVVFAPVDLRPIARDAALDVGAAEPGRVVTVVDLTLGPAIVPDAAPAASGSTAPSSRTPAADDTAAPTGAIARAGAATLSALRRRRARPPVGTAAPAPEPPVVVDPAARRTVIAPIVLGDENRIRQVVTNLLGNARRFTAEESPIELRVGVDLDDEAGMGWVEVIDHGEGIPDAVKDKIFQRFWRADTSRARETGGTGLGLSIVASVVEALHGTVGITDTPGGGATFRVAFPLARDRAAAEHLSIATQPLPRVEPSGD